MSLEVMVPVELGFPPADGGVVPVQLGFPLPLGTYCITCGTGFPSGVGGIVPKDIGFPSAVRSIVPGEIGAYWSMVGDYSGH